MPDFDDAKKKSDGYAFWSGKLSSGEPAMSETRVITNENNTIVGAIRYIVSMEPINSRILLADSAIILIAVIMHGARGHFGTAVYPLDRQTDPPAQ